MQFILSQSIFESAMTDVKLHQALLQLFLICRDDRHSVQTNPVWSPLAHQNTPIDDWCQSLGRRESQLIASMLAEGLSTLPTRPGTRVRVDTIDSSDWQYRRLSLTDAVRVAEMPLQVLVENIANDQAFLLALAPSHWRVTLKQSIDRGWIQFEQGGGITELRKRVKERISHASKEASIRSLRTWVLVDRDVDDKARTWPPPPSATSQDIVNLCADELGCHQLHRRNIESYLPDELLSRVDTPEHTNILRNCLDHETLIPAEHRDTWRDCLEALSRLRNQSPELRYYFSMTSGLLKDSNLSKGDKNDCQQGNRTLTIPDLKDYLQALFQGLSLQPDELKKLSRGFPGLEKNVYACSKQNEHWDRIFQAEFDRGPRTQPTREEIIQSILEWA